MQSLKTLFLYSQTEKESVEEYARNFRSLWDTVETFGGSPGVHQGLVVAELLNQGIRNVSAPQLKAAEEVSSEQVKAALLISGASRSKYGKLKDELANNYLLGTNQYPDTYEKAQRILSNYQNTKMAAPYRASRNDTGVAFLQRGGGRGGRGAGRGGQEGRGSGGSKTEGSGTKESGASDDVSTMTGRTGGDTAKTNSRGESHCFNCGSPSHWAYECPQLSGEQQSQLHMKLEAEGASGEQEVAEDAHQLLNFALTQGGELPDDRVYLDGCSTVTAFKNNRYLQNIKTEERGVRINCNAGAITINKRGTYGNLKVWYLPDGIANIISMNELESLYRITYDSWEGYYIVHTSKGEVRFYKDEQGLPYLDLNEYDAAGAVLLLQHEEAETGVSLVQTVCVFLATGSG